MSVVELGMRDVETTSVAARVDRWVFLHNMDPIIPVPVEEVVSQTRTCSGEKWAVSHWAWAWIKVRGESYGIELTGGGVYVCHIPLDWRLHPMLPATMEGKGATGKSLATFWALNLVAETFSVGGAHTRRTASVGSCRDGGSGKSGKACHGFSLDGVRLKA
jgi:hypothetical protein